MVRMRVAIAGGTGFLGRAARLRLRSAGHEVTTLTRRAGWPFGRPRGRVVAVPARSGPGSASSRAWTRSSISPGEPLARPRLDRGAQARLRDSRLDATRSLVAAMKRREAAPAALVSGSAVGYYGPRGSNRSPKSEPAGTISGQARARLGERPRWRQERLGARVVLLRTGLVLERDGGALQPMLLPFRLEWVGRSARAINIGRGFTGDDWVGRRGVAGVQSRRRRRRQCHRANA